MYIIDGIAHAGEPKKGIEVIEARSVGNLCMLVTFSSGETRLFDATQLLDREAFKPLEDESVFSNCRIERGVVCWLDGDIDIAPESMYALSFQYEQVA